MPYYWYKTKMLNHFLYLYIRSRHLFPVLHFVLEGEDEAVEEGGAEGLHPRLHGLVPDHDPGQARTDLPRGPCTIQEMK